MPHSTILESVCSVGGDWKWSQRRLDSVEKQHPLQASGSSAADGGEAGESTMGSNNRCATAGVCDGDVRLVVGASIQLGPQTGMLEA
ncbi:hypothetical protein L1887_37982 [Cichorium endivia]|nr:hypothetical protein L1887_37982 [Cichorium endivia]